MDHCKQESLFLKFINIVCLLISTLNGFMSTYLGGVCARVCACVCMTALCLRHTVCVNFNSCVGNFICVVDGL